MIFVVCVRHRLGDVDGSTDGAGVAASQEGDEHTQAQLTEVVHQVLGLFVRAENAARQAATVRATSYRQAATV